jgi:hypothetical protein
MASSRILGERKRGRSTLTKAVTMHAHPAVLISVSGLTKSTVYSAENSQV